MDQAITHKAVCLQDNRVGNPRCATVFLSNQADKLKKAYYHLSKCR
jgi:hypothetical protein